MFDNKQLHTLVKALDYAIESRAKYLEQYDGYLSMEEKRAYKKQIEEYEIAKMDAQLEIRNRAIAEQMG